MKESKKKLVAPPEVRAWFSRLGSKGGSVSSKRKAEAVRKNGCAPCAPGKFRGRPKKVSNEN